MFKHNIEPYIIIVLKSKEKYKIECSPKMIRQCKSQMLDNSQQFVDLSSYQFNKAEIKYVFYNEY